MSRAATSSQANGNEHVAQRKGNCVHHWMIESPNGRESSGVCKRCGARKAFANSNESVMWEQTNTLRSDLRESTRFTKPAEIRLSDEE